MTVEAIRGFVAVELSGTITSVLAELVLNLKARVGSGVRWINSENLHMTVNFLGYIPVSLIGNVTETLADCAAISSPIALQIDTINTFPDIFRPSVIWAGPSTIPTSFLKLHELIKGELGGFGSVEKEEIFRPHVTLGRIDRKLSVYSRRMIWESINRSGFHIEEDAFIDGLHFMSTVMRNRKTRYESLRRVVLRG